MECKNHPEKAAVDRCVGCAEPFCGNCLVEVSGQKYCGSCKTMVLEGRKIVLEEATMPCPEAGEALRYAIFSLFCFGIFLGPVAVSKAWKARQIIADDPRLSGYGKANAAIVIGLVGFLLWILSMAGRAARTSRSF
jgi:hypothetical protein